MCGSEGAANELTSKQDLAEAQKELVERRRQKLNRRLEESNLPDVVKDKVRQRSGLWRKEK